jgi:hypothetical protein
LKVRVQAQNLGGATQATSVAFGPVVFTTPVNVTQPTAFGIPRVGEVIQVELDPTDWTNEPTSFTVQRQKDNGKRNGTYTNDGSSSSDPTYTLADADENRIYRWLVVGHNANGDSSAYASTVIGPVGPAVPVLG